MSQHFLHTLKNGTKVLAAGLVPLNNLNVGSQWIRRASVANNDVNTAANTMTLKNINKGMVSYSTDTKNFTESWAQFQYKWIMMVDELPTWCTE